MEWIQGQDVATAKNEFLVTRQGLLIRHISSDWKVIPRQQIPPRVGTDAINYIFNHSDILS